MSKGNNYLMEAFILGSLIYWGLTCVDINVSVNVTDKPIISSVDSADNIHNINQPNAR